MDYLIDGHNLIAAMPDIDLADPDDEVKLVRRLLEWAAAGRKRRVLVIFDGGLVRGKDPNLSTTHVQVFFAGSESADSLLVRRINRVKQPGAFTLITSDRAVMAAAQARRMPTMYSEAFVLKIDEDLRPAPEPELPDEPALSPDEIQAWLDLFGPVPERPPKPPRQRKPEPKPPKPPPRPPATPQQLKAGEAELTPEEMAEWLVLFGPEPSPAESTPAPDAKERQAKKSTSKGAAKRGGKREGKSESAESREPGRRLSESDRAAWLAWLGHDEDDD